MHAACLPLSVHLPWNTPTTMGRHQVCSSFVAVTLHEMNTIHAHEKRVLSGTAYAPCVCTTAFIATFCKGRNRARGSRVELLTTKSHASAGIASPVEVSSPVFSHAKGCSSVSGISYFGSSDLCRGGVVSFSTARACSVSILRRDDPGPGADSAGSAFCHHAGSSSTCTVETLLSCKSLAPTRNTIMIPTAIGPAFEWLPSISVTENQSWN